ncbi:MAG: hypothetical protein AAFN81_25315 [Bacteroidota bacterium]
MTAGCIDDLYWYTLPPWHGNAPRLGIDGEAVAIKEIDPEETLTRDIPGNIHPVRTRREASYSNGYGDCAAYIEVTTRDYTL